MLEVEKYKYVFDIYDKIFKKIRYKKYDIFLCGGASTRDRKTGNKKLSYRDVLRDSLNRDKRNLYNVLYPEDLFTELLGKKKYDLLTMENILADNCDAVLVIPESAGSYAELGAFSNNSNISQKLLVLQQQKYARTHSFISSGPISYMKRTYSGSVIYFNTDIDSISEGIYKWVKNNCSYNHKVPFKDVDKLTGLIYFEILVLYFYESMNIQMFRDKIQDAYVLCVKRINVSSDETVKEVLCKSSIKYLFSKSLLERKGDRYFLSIKGQNIATQILRMDMEENSSHTIDGLRLKIMHENLYS